VAMWSASVEAGLATEQTLGSKGIVLGDGFGEIRDSVNMSAGGQTGDTLARVGRGNIVRGRDSGDALTRSISGNAVWIAGGVLAVNAASGERLAGHGRQRLHRHIQPVRWRDQLCRTAKTRLPRSRTTNCSNNKQCAQRRPAGHGGRHPWHWQ
jgi:hypothetical protein